MNHNTFFKLIGNIYGTKTARLVWNALFSDVLRHIGFRKSKIDDCLYYVKGKMWLIVHVDDVLGIGSKKDLLTVIRRLQ